MEDEGPPPAEAQVQDGPLASRIESKAWKTRMEAYVELTQLVEAAEDAEVAQEYAGKLVKMVVDTNLNAQQKGIEVASACARKMNVDAVAGWVHSVMAKTVDKAFGQVKCKGTAQELAMLLIEAEQGEMVSPRSASLCDVDESPAELRDCGTRGVPRRSEPPHLHLRAVVHAAVECVRMAVQGFGLKALGPTPKPVVKLSVALLEASATTAPVRAEAKLLAVELHRYMGAALRPSYDNLRPAQQKDLDDAFAEAPKAKPTRMTRAVAAAAAARLAAGEPEEEVADAGGGEGEFEIEAVDVLAKLPKDFNEKIFTVAKWTEKKEMLDELVKLANSPKVAPGDFAELTKTLKRLTGDSMVVVVATSIQALAALAKGLKKDFAQYARNSTSTLFDRLKEKDRRVVEACHTALDAYLAGCVSVTDMVDDLTVALGPKGIPKSKSEVLKFLTRSIDSKVAAFVPKTHTPVAAFVPKTHKPVFEAIIKGTEDAAPDIREGSFIVLAALIKTVGFFPAPGIREGAFRGQSQEHRTTLGAARACGADVMRAPLASLDDKRRKKIEALAGSDGAPAPAAAAAPKATAPKKVVKSAAASDAPAKAKGGAKAAKAKESKDEAESETAGVSTEELDTLVQTLIADDVRAKLKSSNWKERLEAIERLEEDAKANAGEMAHPAPEAWVRLLAVSFVERKETNFQTGEMAHPEPEAWVRLMGVAFVERTETNFHVLNKVHLVVATLAEKAPKFTKRAAHWFIPHMIEKLGDVKLKQGAHDALLTIAEAATPQFVLNQGFEATKKQKAPKTIESALLWVNAMVADFGHKLIKAKPLLEMVKGMLEHANPGVKKASVEILVSMRRQLGPELRSQLADVKPALLTSIDEAFAKVAEEAPVVPRRGLKGADGEDGGEEVAEVQEVVSLTTPIAAHIKGLSDANWKERQ
ncbi:armadillo-type protein, partial [Baffinella frigidus]